MRTMAGVFVVSPIDFEGYSHGFEQICGVGVSLVLTMSPGQYDNTPFCLRYDPDLSLF